MPGPEQTSPESWPPWTPCPRSSWHLPPRSFAAPSKWGCWSTPLFRRTRLCDRAPRKAAAALAITLVPAEVRLPDDLDAAFHSLARERVEAVLVLQDPMSLAERRRIAMLAMAARLPTMFGFREYVEAGGLMSYGLDLRANFRRGRLCGQDFEG